MSWFSKRKENVQNSEITRLEARIVSLEAEILAILTSIAVIRNKVLRKIQFKQEPDQEEEDLNNKTYSNILPKDNFMGRN